MTMLMNTQTVEQEIGGIMFSTTTFPAMHSALLLARLLKTMGGAVGGLLKLDQSAELDTIGSEIAAAFSSLSPDDVVKLIPDILANTSAMADGKVIELGKKAGLDMVFTGRLMLMFKTIGFVLGANYRDFTPGGNDSSTNSAIVPAK